MPGQRQFTAELADLLKRLGDRESTFQPRRDTYWLPIAEHLVAVGFRLPQRITTIGDLDTIPVRTVIVDDWETVWRRGEVSWFACDKHPDAPARIVLPASVLHTPRNGDNR